ncbi:MAG: heterodisulfide reductase-related iron-sulfur binding cluster [Desulfurococcaceae archaeon]
MITRSILYYPGCTVKRNAMEYEKTAIAILGKIGFKIIELNKWYCCGTLYSLTIDDLSKHIGAIRVLINAQKESVKYKTSELLTLCPMCFNVLKRVNNYLTKYPDKLETISRYIDEEEPYKIGIVVKHVVETLVENIDAIKKNKVIEPGGKRIAVYYGCTIVRPREIGIDNPEDPVIIEKFLNEIGFETIDYPYKTLCCGSYQVLLDKNIVYRNSSRILNEIVNRNVNLLITVCPLCLYNLRETVDKFEKKIEIKIIYLTDIVAYVMGLRNSIDSNTLSFLDKVFSSNPLS